MRAIALICCVLLAGCTVTTTSPTGSGAPAAAPKPDNTPKRNVNTAVKSFDKVVGRMRPAMERTCKEANPRMRCDFRVYLENREGRRNVVNAYQTLGRDGAPEIYFTTALVAETRNDDELAFVLGHEAAHHIAGHLQERAAATQAGALILGSLASAYGGGAIVDAASQTGALIGSRVFSKQNELEADKLGTVITKRGGYNPVRGSQFFGRIPDPGDQFLGTHPPNAQRLEIVRQTAARL